MGICGSRSGYDPPFTVCSNYMVLIFPGTSSVLCDGMLSRIHLSLCLKNIDSTKDVPLGKPISKYHRKQHANMSV